MKKLFGMTGIRGVAGKYPLTANACVKLGEIISQIVSEERKEREEISIVIGMDTRVSGGMIVNALSSGILSGGCDVINVGIVTTPSLVYMIESMRANLGIMVTASHNPYQDNGVKIFLPQGLRMAEEKIKKIEELMDDEEFNVSETQNIGKITYVNDADGRCIEHLKALFPKDLTLAGLKIGLDFANGAGSFVGERLFQELGANIEVRGNKPNGRNINAGFGSVYPEVLSKLVVDNNLDIGIALDGDGDRLVLVDEDGTLLDGDEILAILAIYLKEEGKLKNDAIVATIMSNMGLDECLRSYGIEVKRSRVGEVYVLEEMLKFDLSLGGEQSGHIILSDVGNSGEGMATALKVLEIMVKTGKSLKELRSNYKCFPQKLKSLLVLAKPALEEIAGYPELKSKIEKEFNSDGRILIRYSETENKIRVMVEHKDIQVCDETLNTLVNFFSEKIGA